MRDDGQSPFRPNTRLPDTIANVLSHLRVLDLSQPLGPLTALWPGSQPFAAEAYETHEGGDGSYTRRFATEEHAGTHLDAPAHFAADGVMIDGIDPSRLVCPAVVIDIAERCAGDPDALLEPADIDAHEAAHGRIPAGAAVLVRTGWDAHRGDAARYVEDLRFPGVGVDAARVLVERGAAGIGIDTLGIDAGCARDFPVHATVTLPAGLWHLEGLVGLDALPPRGAWVVVGAIKLADGSGAPARVFALTP